MTNDGQAATQQAELALAQEFLARALNDRQGGFIRGSVSSAYYATFHAAKAALSMIGVDAKSHEGVQQLFSLHFIKSGRFPPSDGKLLRRMQKDRQDADYAIYSVYTREDADEAIDNARGFLARVTALSHP